MGLTRLLAAALVAGSAHFDGVYSIGFLRKTNTIVDDKTCQCQSDSPTWASPKATRPARCYFIDLGAADGNSYLTLLGENKDVQFRFDTGNFQPSDCHVVLVEANPAFTPALERVVKFHGAETKAEIHSQEAIYICDKERETFNIDVESKTGWGSSLDNKHPSVTTAHDESKEGASTKRVDIRLTNLMRILKETVLPHDTVTVKMDIEGAEWDILPCLAESPKVASLIDTLYFENHCPEDEELKIKAGNKGWCPSKGQRGNTRDTFEVSLQKLKDAGVTIVSPYFSKQ